MKRRTLEAVRRATNGLTSRLVVLLSMALLPLGAISIHSAAETQRAAQRAGERNLITLAADSVAGERALIESALTSARTLEQLALAQRADEGACSDLMRSHVARSNIYSVAGFIDLDGSVTCRSQGEAIAFGDSAAFQRLRAAPATTLGVSPAGAATGLPVIIVTRPVFNDHGLEGFISISIARRTLPVMNRSASAR